MIVHWVSLRCKTTCFYNQVQRVVANKRFYCSFAGQCCLVAVSMFHTFVNMRDRFYTILKLHKQTVCGCKVKLNVYITWPNTWYPRGLWFMNPWISDSVVPYSHLRFLLITIANLQMLKKKKRGNDFWTELLNFKISTENSFFRIRNRIRRREVWGVNRLLPEPYLHGQTEWSDVIGSVWRTRQTVWRFTLYYLFRFKNRSGHE